MSLLVEQIFTNEVTVAMIDGIADSRLCAVSVGATQSCHTIDISDCMCVHPVLSAECETAYASSRSHSALAIVLSTQQRTSVA